MDKFILKFERMATRMSDLPEELVEEILSRVPLKPLRAVRRTYL